MGQQSVINQKNPGLVAGVISGLGIDFCPTYDIKGLSSVYTLDRKDRKVQDTCTAITSRP